MKSVSENGHHLIVLERGEEVIGTLTEYCERSHLTHAFFQGLGAVEEAEVGFYRLNSKSYDFKILPETHEVASLLGNITLVEGKPFVHAHVVLSRADDSLSCVGGHLKKARVAVTLEIHLTTLAVSVERKLDDAIGLRLIDAR